MGGKIFETKLIIWLIPVEKFDQWLQKRAEALSVATNSLLKSLTQ
jgi:hypothetical protein